MDSNNGLLTPGQCIRPPMTIEMATILLERLYGMRATKTVELNAYDDKNYHVFCEEAHVNPYVSAIEGHGYVLKVVNSLDSQKTAFFEAQNEVLIYLHERGIACPLPLKNLRGRYYSLEKLPAENSNDEYIVRLLVYKPGEVLCQVSVTGRLLYKIGAFAAKLDETLRDFFHPGYEGHRTLWMLVSLPKLRQFTFAVKNDADRRLVHDVIDSFENEVLKATSNLAQGIIHGDLNEQNIILNFDGSDIAAVIDFGDSQKTCLVFELAVALCYMILHARDVTMGRYVVEGYESVRKLTDLEKEVLKVSVCARICQSLVMGAYSYLHNPQNEYLLSTQEAGWMLLKVLWPMSKEEVFKAWSLLAT